MCYRVTLLYILLQGEVGPYLLGYECHTCAPGCERCTDSRPCVLTLNWTLRTVVLVASCLVIFSIPLLLWFTVQFQDVKVIIDSALINYKLEFVSRFLLPSCQ